MRLWVWAAAFAVVSGVAPSVASATTARIEAGQLLLDAAPGEQNRLSVYKYGEGAVAVHEQLGLPLTPGAGCTAVPDPYVAKVQCSMAGVTRIVIRAGDRDDMVETYHSGIPSRRYGEAGNDGLGGGEESDDELIGGEGDDSLSGDDGADLMDGGAGDDVLVDDNPSGGPGNGDDRLLGGPGNDSLNAYASGDDILDGGDGNDSFWGAQGQDVEDGGPGDDVFDVGGDPGADELTGGPGRDHASYHNRVVDGVLMSADGIADDGNALDEFGGRRDRIVADVENLTGTDQADILTGTDAGNVLDGRDGDDRLTGAGGDDELLGGAGRDRLDGDGANDLLWGGPHADTLNGGTGDDVLSYLGYAAAVTVDLDGQPGDDGAAGEGDSAGGDIEDLWGGNGADRLTGNASENFIDGGPGADVIDGRAGTDFVDFSDRVGAVEVRLVPGTSSEGDALTNLEGVFGGDGDDTLAGDDGVNVLDGGAGDDRLDGAFGADVLEGGDGYDMADYSARSAPVTADLDGVDDDGVPGENDMLRAVEDLAGGAGDDTLTGDGSANILDGGPGNDAVTGGAGEDLLWGDIGDDRVFSQDGEADEVTCGGGIDAVAGDSVDTLDECESLNGVSLATPAPAPAPAAPAPAAPRPIAPSAPPFELSVEWPRRVELSGSARRGMRLWFRCGRACSVTGVLRVDRATARRLGVRSLPRRGSVVLARGSTKLAVAGRAPMTLRPTASGKQAKLRAGSAKGALHVVAAGATGERVERVRRLTLRR